MTSARNQAETATAAILRILSLSPGEANATAVAGIIEQTLNEASREQEKRELQRVANLQASAHARLTRLLNAAPAVTYSRLASGNYDPTFVSESITSLFGVTPREYFDNPNLWRERVHPDDIARIAAWIDQQNQGDKRSIEYRYRRLDGTYCWVNDQQHWVRDAKGEPLEIVGSWSDITARKEAEEAREIARSQLALLLPAVISHPPS